MPTTPSETSKLEVTRNADSPSWAARRPNRPAYPKGANVERLSLCWDKMAPRDVRNWADLLHALKLWETDLGRAESDWSSQRMLEMVVDSEKAQATLSFPLFVQTRHGLVSSEGPFGRRGEIHPDQALAVLGKIGIRTDRAIAVSGRSFLVSDLIQGCVANFTWEQEIEWSAISLALYLPPRKTWTNKYGEVFTFDQLIEKLSNRGLGEGQCFGLHVLQALDAVLAADGEHPILSPEAKLHAKTKVGQIANLVTETQGRRGYWIRWWDRESPPGESESVACSLEALAATSHLLEFLAHIPPDIAVDLDMVARGTNYLACRILDASPSAIASNYATFCHAANALRRWHPEAWTIYRQRKTAHLEGVGRGP